MKNLFNPNSRFVKFIQLAVCAAFLCGAAFGATWTVTKAADTNDGICSSIDCSLREAITAADINDGDDVINFDATFFSTPRTIPMAFGDYRLNGSGTLIISGPGANLLTIDGLNQIRIFTVNAATVTISGVTMKNGRGVDTSNLIFGGGAIGSNAGSVVTVNDSIISNNAAGYGGGGIRNGGSTLTLNNTIVRNNLCDSGCTGAGIYNAPNSTASINGSTVTNNSASSNGGGIYNDNAASLSVVNSTVANNSISGTGGGGIYNFSGSLTVTNSNINNNTTSPFTFGTGGGIYNSGGSLTVTNSTFNGNSGKSGGGLYNNGNTVSISGSTFSNNSASDGYGGGILNDGALTIINSTFAANTATITNNFSGGYGGGLYNSGTLSFVSSTVVRNTASANAGGFYNNGGTINARNTIFADNAVSGSGDAAQDFSGVLNSQGYNLIKNPSGATINGTTVGNILGRDAQLLPLGNYGGATQTVPPLASSPAVDAGDPNNSPAADQRGAARPVDGNLDGAALPDIGAYETQPTAFIVTKTADTNDGACNADCSLREAIAAANAAAATPDITVVFDNALFAVPQTITLTGGELAIANGAFSIVGKGANRLTVSGNNQSRVLSIGSAATAGITGVAITGGNATGNGGGVSNGGKLFISNSTINANAATGNGGGVFNNNNGTIVLSDSTVSGNTATTGGGLFTFNGSNLTVAFSTVNGNTASSNYGGGISNNGGSLTVAKSTLSRNAGGGVYNGGTANISDSTISGNTSGASGGGIFNDVLLNLYNSTVADNRVAGQGGGIYRSNGTVNARNSIIADNSANNSAPDFFGTLQSGGYNLIENTSGATIAGTFSGNITGQDPRLLPLGNYGGATETQALKATSPAIDKGFSFVTVTTDQRGQTRPYDFPNISNGSGNGSDIGAYERQPNDIAGFTPFDFDRDGKADISVFRPSTGTWYLQQSQAGFAGVNFGQTGDVIVPADYDGDGKADEAVFRSGTWYIQRSSLGFTGVTFGEAADIPVPADYDGDGKADVAVFRPSTGIWYLLRSSLGYTGIAFGQTGDKPVAADYDGDGKADVAVNRGGTWYIQRSQLGFVGIAFGDANDKLVPADYDGDGKADVAVYRPSNGTWYLQRSTLGFTGIAFGISTDLPTPADYDGDGKADIAVFRDGTWYLQRSTAGFTGVAFGAASDKPVPNAFVR